MMYGTMGKIASAMFIGCLWVLVASSPVLASPLQGEISLSQMGVEWQGATLRGGTEPLAHPDWSGYSVSSAGDVNADGIDDLIIGGPQRDNQRGRVYVVYGKDGASTLQGLLDLETTGSALDGFVLEGEFSNDTAGWSVSNAGDVNGDGVDDILVGAPDEATSPTVGQMYLIYGQSGGAALSGSFQLADVGTTVAGVHFDEGTTEGGAGFSVSNAGDINGDGVADLLIGAKSASPNGDFHAGETYLVYGQTGAAELSGTIDVTDVGSTVSGAVFQGIDPWDHSGRSVSNAGDVNGDGVDDLLIGAPANVGSSVSPEAYLVYGQTGVSTLTGDINLTSVGGSVAGAVFKAIDALDRTGWSVSTAGDVDGDGIDDLLVSSPAADPNGVSGAGEIYLIYGKLGVSALSGAIDLDDVGGAVDGAVFFGTLENLGSANSVSNAGDVNGDGFDDLLFGVIAAPGDSVSQAGETYLVYGQDGALRLSGRINLGAIGTSVAGARFDGIDVQDWSGRSVSSAGDVNNDGLDDLLIGAFLADHPNGTFDVGETYLIYGQAGAALPIPEPATLCLVGIGLFAMRRSRKTAHSR